MPNVLNKRIHGQPPGSVYIGRPSAWGNPFSHLPGTLAQFQVANRDEAVDQYEAWLLAQPELVATAQRTLAGKDLVCWCAPSRCHGDVLTRIANLSPVPSAPARVEVSHPGALTGQFRRTPRRP